jgi:RNA-binding protein
VVNVRDNQAMPKSLTTRERAHLKARAHALEPRVQVGHSGMTDAVAAEVDRALTAHELIKVKILDGDRDVRRQIADTLCTRTDAALVQSVGKVFVLWRPKAEETQDADE